MTKRVALFFITILLLLVGTTTVVLYGRGYRIGFEKDKLISGTGLLVATSSPDGAQIFINGRLNSATNDTLNLLPGDYNVAITKEGFLPWKKNLTIQKEIVTKTDALLFPVAPVLTSITSTGVASPSVDPTRTRIAYKITNLTPQKNGIYILEIGSRPILTLQSSATKVVDDSQNLFSKAQISFSPNGKNIIATISAQQQNITYLVSLDNQSQKAQEISQPALEQLQEQWQKEKEEKETSRLNSLKPELAKIIFSSFKILAWSNDETKILYEASSSAALPLFINPPLIGANSQPEERKIERGKVYVYDIKEDKNFEIKAPTPSLIWFPDSRHLIIADVSKIEILEYDGTNKTTVYAGPFEDNFVAPWPDGSKLVILTNLANPNVTPNLYTVSLK